MKALKKISLIFVLFFLYTFVLSRNYLPETIAVKGEEIRISCRNSENRWSRWKFL